MPKSRSKESVKSKETKSHEREKVKCKGCGKDVTLLLSHLERTQLICQEFYDMKSMREEAETLKKDRKAQRSRERYHNEPGLSAQKKDAARQLYHQNSERKKETMRTYYDKSRQDVQHDYECPICEKKFFLLKYVQRHIRDEHENTYTCQICDKIFQNKANLERHMKEIHGGQKHGCKKCPATYTRKEDLKKHIDNCWHFFEYHCDLCEETLVFKSLRSLIEHIIVKQPESEEKAGEYTIKSRRSGIFVTCKSYKKGFDVDGEKGSLTYCRSEYDKLMDEKKRLQYKEKFINAGLIKANTKFHVELKFIRQKHEAEDQNGTPTCNRCKQTLLPTYTKGNVIPRSEFCNSRYDTRNWTMKDENDG